MSSHEATTIPSLGSIARLSRRMCAVIAIGAALSLGAVIWVWLSPGFIEQHMAQRLGLAGASIAVDAGTRLVGFAVSMVPMAVLLVLLSDAFLLFDGYRRGEIFTDAAPARLRRIGLCMIALAVLRPLTATVLGVVLTAGNPPGERFLSIGLSMDDYMIGAFGGLILAIGHVMVEAKRLADETREIV